MKTFSRVIIIGYGKVTGEVLVYVKEKQKDYGYEMEFIEHEIHPFSVTERLCGEYDVPFRRIEDKKELAAYLSERGSAKKTLIISASNNFLFPKALAEQENVTIMNFHNALLPEYPGRNAPSWVIFMGEKKTGITWHYVTAGIDEGSVIIQKTCEIGAETKAYELTEQLMNLAYEAFVECFDDVITEQAQAVPQEFSRERRMYRSYEVPADGFFDMTWKTEEIYRLLRSVDYGKNEIFPHMQTVIDGKKAEILRYRKINPEKQKDESGFLYLPFADGSLLKLKYRML